MTPAPLSKVIGVVARATKYNPVKNREQCVETVNGVMGLLFRTPALRINYFQASECTLVQRFTENCNTPGPMQFLGVVMPPGVMNIREIRINNIMFEITEQRVGLTCAPVGFQSLRSSQWNRTWRNPGACQPKAEHLKPRLLERDIPRCDNRQVSFRSSDEKDCGKAVGVRYIDLNGNEQREDLVLNSSPVLTSVSVLEFLEISFPERRGWLHVETAEGFALGRYHPSIYTPVHEWFRLQSACVGAKAEWRGIREPYPAVFDTDMIPFSDDTLWRLAIKAYQNLDSMELTPSQTNALARMYSQLAAVTTEDLAAKNYNFNNRLLPESGREMLATGKLFSRR